MAAPASVVDVDDALDSLPLKSLRTVVGAQKIVDEKRKEEEALAAEPSLGFNEEWCKAHQDKVASSFKIQDIYGHMMPPQDGQSPIPVLAQFLSIVSTTQWHLFHLRAHFKHVPWREFCETLELSRVEGDPWLSNPMGTWVLHTPLLRRSLVR